MDQGSSDEEPLPTSIRPIELTAAPNPFNPSVQISFSGAIGEFAVVRVFDLRGRMVDSLFSGAIRSARTSLAWHGTNEDGIPMRQACISSMPTWRVVLKSRRS